MKNQKNAINYILYARKSSESEDRQILSIDSQIKELKDLAKKENLKITEVITEAKSAKAPGRKGFKELIEKIENGKANGILCWKLDRLARNPMDGGTINWKLQQGTIKHIKTFDRDWYPTDNVLMMSVEFGMANQFILDLSSNTKRGMRAKAEQGGWPHLAPPGYLNNPQAKIKKDAKKIIKDPSNFNLIRKAFDMMLTGNYSVPFVLNEINSWGYRNKQANKMSRTVFYKIFSNPFYYGCFEYPCGSGNWHEGKHEPMITKQEYDRIQLLLGKQGKIKRQKKFFAFRGFIECGECGASITAENKIKRQKNGNVHYYTYYHCTKRTKADCSQGSIQEDKLEEEILKLIKRIEISPEFHEWAMSWIKYENKKESEDRNKILSSQQKAYNSCIKKIDRLIDMRTNDEITEEEFKNKKFVLSNEKTQLIESLGNTDNRVNQWIKKADQVLTFAENARAIFENGSPEVKKNILANLGSNLLLKDGKLTIQAKNPLIVFKNISERLKEENSRFEPPEICSNKRKNRDLVPAYPSWLRRWDSNPRQTG